MHRDALHRSGACLTFLRTAAVCAALTGVGLATIQAVQSVLARTDPYVDFSRRATVADLPLPPPGSADDHLRFAVASMVTAEATFSTYQRLVTRICGDVGREESFILRPSYADVRRGLEEGTVSVAFVCTGTYLHSLGTNRIRLLAQPEFSDGLQYRCLIIVPASSKARTLSDLHGRVMAFTDPESNTGCIVPTIAFMDTGENLKTFFRKVVFTGSHDRSILAVAVSAVDAAAVDALVWQSKVQADPSLADRVRVIWQSEPFGPPPIVVSATIDDALEDALRKAFLDLDKDDEGKAILSAIGIRRFVHPEPDAYRSAELLYRRFRQSGGSPWR